jgi:glucose/arabinose dehydrogenase
MLRHGFGWLWGFLFLAACGGGGPEIDDSGNTTTRDANGVAACTATAGVNLATHLVADGFRRPIFVTSPPNDPRLFVVEQGGVIHIVSGTQVLGPAFLGIANRVLSVGSEQGLLGLAFHPDFAVNGRFFVHYTAKESDQGEGAAVIAEFRVSDADPNRADFDSERRILEVAHADFENHNSGMIAFGPDGYLYIGTGDGGSGGDPFNNGQNLDALLGKILRIDVDGGEPYEIPPSNPFVGTAGAREEIWAYGLRNPWRFSFDRMLGDLYIGDVGQAFWEEIDVQPAASAGGENYGWDHMEGAHCYDPMVDCDMVGKTLPVTEYMHMNDRCSVTGGYVYRGECLTDYQGQYFFGDVCTNETWTMPAGMPEEMPEEITENLAADLSGISSFGENADGELFIVSLYNGRVYQVIPE